ncbi:MAG: hypothetical protein A2W25_16930 [candidate division Zixibacteria bacterium RBG_16_53_22]|nr:MAG: hypothetical protein A2W25_16930 [candidate division Zixibacteria bacterium RBG_16_53_22]
MSRYKTALILAALVFFAAANAHAIIFGIRYSNLMQEPLPGISDTGSKGRFGAYLGFKEKNSVILVGADYDRYKLERGDSLLYSRRLVVNLGYRYHLLPTDKAEAMDMMPFVALHLFKSFSKVSADSTILSTAEAQYYKDLSNDVGGWVSLGAEYNFAPAFSFGGEAGFRYARAKSKAYGHEIKLGQYSTFVALLLTFYW